MEKNIFYIFMYLCLFSCAGQDELLRFPADLPDYQKDYSFSNLSSKFPQALTVEFVNERVLYYYENNLRGFLYGSFEDSIEFTQENEDYKLVTFRFFFDHYPFIDEIGTSSNNSSLLTRISLYTNDRTYLNEYLQITGIIEKGKEVYMTGVFPQEILKQCLNSGLTMELNFDSETSRILIPIPSNFLE